ncbi:uncharacterized protein RCO7_11616 [Rhynchosporium graminicola]|uniref:Uncharacterized protein n=1 Tax=Rhynchosporium graminicola TaxID=2792576 RepID=A0A1E1KPW8_9HELO|nr:uncharacterized protein RCO7_11616 [Rhynchosporium commune]
MLSTPENDPCSVRNTLAEINIAIDRDGNLGDETSSLQPKNLLLAQPQTLGLSFAALKYNTSDLDAYVSCDVQPAEAKNPGSAGLFIPASSAISVLQALDEATVSFSSTSSLTSVESLPDCDGGVSHQPFSNFGMGTEDCRGLLISPQLSDALPSFSQDQSWNSAEGLVYTGAMPSPPFKSLTAGFSSVCSGSAFYASPFERPGNFPPLSFDEQFMPCSGTTWTGQDLFVADHAIPDCTSYGSSQDSFIPLADEGLWFWQAPIPQPKSLVTADSFQAERPPKSAFTSCASQRPKGSSARILSAQRLPILQGQPGS